MKFDILLTKQPENGYVARVLSLPEITVCGESEEEALACVRTKIEQVLEQSRLVQIEVPMPDGSDHPWLRFAGMFEDDPDWDFVQEEIEKFRREIDETTGAFAE